MSALPDLRRALEERYGATLPVRYGSAQVVGTGVAALDALLPGGGLPRGRLTQWAPGGGATAVLRTACAAAVERGERAAWVDGAGTLVAEQWSASLLLLRPASEVAALLAAEELLRSGGFALVVLSGAGDRLARDGVSVRLTRGARAGGSVFVAITERAPVAQLRLKSRVPVDGFTWLHDAFGEPVAAQSVRVEVEASALGWSGHTAFTLGVLERGERVAAESGLADRRGARLRWRQRNPALRRMRS
jgi:recombination protein RecA